MTRKRITIIGTGCIGASMGMALRQSPAAKELEIVGHDREQGIARQAEKDGAFDNTMIFLNRALRDAAVVVLAVPLGAMREVLSDLGRLLEPDSGVIVTDTAPLKAPVLAWADELLPPGVHFIGGDPILVPAEEGGRSPSSVVDARPDLLQHAVYTITVRPTDDREAIEAVTNLADLVGATPLYMDPVEHDGVRQMMHTLPDLAATALIRATSSHPGWSEMRKVASHRYATVTAAIEGDLESRRLMAEMGATALLSGIDNLIEELQALREAIAAGKGDDLAQRLEEAANMRERWLIQALSRNWEGESAPSPELPSAAQRTIEILFGRRKKRGQ
ncbi:MAG: prephenate dehydrogenase [Anaerolineae bacterium]